MREVLRDVREALGPEALVISTRTVRDRKLFGRFTRPLVEVTAAVDREPLVAKPTEPADDRRPTSDLGNELRLAKALVNPLEAEIQRLRRSVDQLSARPEPSIDLAEELRALRRVAREIASSADPKLSARESVEGLAGRLDAALRPPRPDDDSVMMYVGPPGAGKTTTLAKIAACTESTRGDLVVLSTDCNRLGADASLRAFAKQLDVPFETVVSPRRLAEVIAKRGRRPVLVDTAGRSRRDDSALPELRALRDALGERARVCLVLPANGRESDLRSDVARYEVLKPDAMVLTKVDESDELDDVAKLLLDGGCPPLQWIATGQRVPDDLVVADPRDLAERILGASA